MITSATFQTYEFLGSDTYRVKLHLIDDTAPAYDKWLTVNGSTLAELRDDASRQIAAWNAKESGKNILAGIAIGTNIPVTYTPPAPPAPTAKQIWQGKARSLAIAGQLGTLSGASAADVTALRNDVIATYAAGFLVDL